MLPDSKYSLRSKHCTKMFTFVTVSKSSSLFNKTRIYSGSFSLKTAFLPLIVFKEKRQMRGALHSLEVAYEIFFRTKGFPRTFEGFFLKTKGFLPKVYESFVSEIPVKCLDDSLRHQTQSILRGLNITRKCSLL